MEIFIFFIIHWYASLFFQSLFHHRYAAHNHFTMSKGWEKVFFIGCYITQGSSYISAYAYGIMHRLHHAHTDTEMDPHSPDNSPNLFTMWKQTRDNYFDIYSGRVVVEDRYKKDLPQWHAFDRLAHTWPSRMLWLLIYITFYFFFATQWWMWLFLPLQFFMGSMQGAAVNWWAHRFGYTNFDMDNTSKNILPVDPIFWGESFHNNHHKHPGRVNNAHHWWEVDMGFLALRGLNAIGVVQLKDMRPKKNPEKLQAS
jgi:stearoyl-CoA desaturase (Delta-9 desaturase)